MFNRTAQEVEIRPSLARLASPSILCHAPANMSTDLNRYLKLQTALTAERNRIEARLAAISKVLGYDAPTADATTTSPAPASAPAKPGRKQFSEATKAKMRLSQQAR